MAVDVERLDDGLKTMVPFGRRRCLGLLGAAAFGAAARAVVPRRAAASPGTPAPCLDRATATVSDFVDAFNRGDQTRLAKLFPPLSSRFPEQYQAAYGWYGWYGASTPGRPGALVSFRQGVGDLLAYLAARHAHHERLQIRQLAVRPAFLELVAVDATLTRQADDFPARTVTGTGMVDGRLGALRVWAMTEAGEPVLRLDSDTFPAGCAPDDAVRFVNGFLDAFNRGDWNQFIRYFPPSDAAGNLPPESGVPQPFRGYSVSTIEHGRFEARARNQLLAHFAQRHAAHEQLQLLDIGLFNNGGRPGRVGFSFRLRWRADDLAERIGGGKGAITCSNPKTLYVWVLTDRP